MQRLIVVQCLVNADDVDLHSTVDYVYDYTMQFLHDQTLLMFLQQGFPKLSQMLQGDWFSQGFDPETCSRRSDYSSGF